MFRTLFQVVRRKNDNQLFWVVLITAAIASGAISLWIGMRQSIWFDEAYSILVAKQSIGELIRLTGLDTHPPLYYLMLKAWAGVFGWGELALRSLSIVGLIGSIVMGGALVRKMFGGRIAIGAVLLVMIAPLLLRYGFEVRMYSWASFIGIAATYALYSAWRAKTKERLRWLVLYGVLVAIGMFTLYYLALLWLAHVAWLVYVHLKSKLSWKALLPYAMSYAGAVMLFAPWLPTFFGQLSNGALAPIGQPLNLDQLLGIVTFNLVYQPPYMLSIGFTVVILAVFASLAWSIPRAKQALHGRHNEVALLGMYIAVPIIILMIISLARPMYTERYLAHVAIGLMLLLSVVVIAAVTVHRKDRRAVWVLGVVYGAVLLGGMQLAVVGNFNFQRMQTPTVREATASISDCASGTRLLAADPYVATELAYYLAHCQIYFASQWDTLKGGYAPFSGSSYQIKDVKTLNDWRVTYVFYGTPDQAMPNTYREEARRTYGALNIVEYVRQ